MLPTQLSTSMPGASTPPPSSQPAPAEQPDQPIGSKATGYTGADISCANCFHFDGQGSCDQPEVVADPEVNGQVEAEGRCNEFEAKQGNEAGEQPEAPGQPAGLAADHPLQALKSKPRRGGF